MSTEQIIVADGYYLTEGSRSRGTQGGIGRVWSEDRGAAKRFPSLEAAREFAFTEFGPRYEIEVAFEAAPAKTFPIHCMDCKAVTGRATISGSTGLCDSCLEKH